MRSLVYKNLNRGDWSLAMPAGKSGTLRGKVTGHANHVVITDPEFIVQESGRVRVITKRCREVHAWIVGDIVDASAIPCGMPGRVITYNPYRSAAFHYRDNGEPVTAARFIHFASDGTVTAYNQES
jgi:hypothetical protein